MNKRKDVCINDQENVSKKPKNAKIESLNEAKNPFQERNLNQIANKIENPKQNEINDDVILAEETEKNVALDNQDKINKQNSINQIKLIKELLKNTKSSGETSVGGEAVELPIIPGLFVKNVGDISMPLCPQQAEDLIKVCKQAPFGLNYETLVDTNVRDSFELEPGQIEIRNESWHQGLEKLVEKVAKDLGCVGKVKASLYKMLLYKQGGHFKKHRDTEKEKGMFGTLIIQLPSIYTGGELMVYDNSGGQYKYDFGQANRKSGYSVHYAAHYADLEHEIFEIKSGYRLVLIYNLCWLNGNGVCLNDGSSVAHMASALSILNESFIPLAIFLEHKYTDESFQTNGIKALKGTDNQRYNLLKNASNRLPDDKKLNFYIVSASLTVTDEADDDGGSYSYHKRECKSDESESDDTTGDYEELTQSKKIERLFDSNGRIYKDLKLSFNFFSEIIDLKKSVNEKINLEDRKAWGKYISVEESGYTGNEGATVTTMYHKYFLMILPKSKELKLAFSISLSHGADKVLELWDSHLSNEQRFLNYFKLLLKSIKEKPKSGYSYCYYSSDLLREDQTNKVLDILFYLNDVSLAKYYLSNCHNKYAENDGDKFANLIKQFGFEALKPSLNKFILPIRRTNIAANCSLVRSLFDLNEQDLAFELFNECIKPVLVSQNQFSDIKNSGEGYSAKINVGIYSDLLKTIIKFEKYADFETNMESFKNSVIATLDVDSYEKLFEGIMNNINGFSSIKQILDLFKHRVKWLEDKLNNVKEFSWSMPNASVPKHRQLEEFLRSERSEMTYRNFDTISYARNFANHYGGLKNGYSVEMRAGGTGRNSYVEVVKTRKYHEHYVKALDKYKAELGKIKQFNLNI